MGSPLGPGATSHQFYSYMYAQAETLREESGCVFGQLAGDLMLCMLSYARYMVDTGFSPSPELIHQDLTDCVKAFSDRIAAEPASAHMTF